MSTFTIADSFDATDSRLRVDLSAPLPLGYTAAVRRALELRERGGHWSYPVISDVFAEYHGIHRGPTWWRKHLVAAGAERRGRGVMCCGPDRVAAA